MRKLESYRRVWRYLCEYDEQTDKFDQAWEIILQLEQKYLYTSKELRLARGKSMSEN